MGHSEEFIIYIKKELTSQRETIKKELGAIEGDGLDGPRFPDRGDDEGENAQEVAEFSNRLSLSETLEKSLRDIEKALERIDQGTYGTCKHCNILILEARLKARPASSSCIDCKKSFLGE